jgi:hypothetical protein
MQGTVWLAGTMVHRHLGMGSAVFVGREEDNAQMGFHRISQVSTFCSRIFHHFAGFYLKVVQK